MDERGQPTVGQEDETTIDTGQGVEEEGEETDPETPVGRFMRNNPQIKKRRDNSSMFVAPREKKAEESSPDSSNT